jgi:hypothetical protein
MHSSLFSKPDLLKTFMPLSDEGKSYLEILLVNAKANKAEGRGFFNDPDFLLEACRGLVGRYNFCLSNFAYNQAQIPTRAAYNQFDRSLSDFPGQDQARAHSFSLSFLFKPELIQEMTAPGQHPSEAVNFVKEIEGILARIGAKRYGMDYFLTGVAVRMWAPVAMHKRPLSKPALTLATKKLLEALEKKMTPLEHKHFALTSSVTGKIFDPVPGLPGIFVPDAPDSMVVTSSGDLEPGEEGAIGALLEDAFEAKRGKGERPKSDGYATPLNIQGLSQSWSETTEPQYESAAGAELERRTSLDAEPNGPAEQAPREDLRELETWFQDYVRGKWRWPLYSSAFNKLHQGAGCGELLMLRCDPFAGEPAFQFLLQSAETFAKEGTGQVLVFSKRRALGELALSSLSRHYRANPLAGKPTGGLPDANSLARAYDALFPHPPQLIPCNREDGLDQLLKYIEHDFLPKQRKRGTGQAPLVILIDNLDEFSGTQNGNDKAGIFRSLSLMKMRLRDFNASLWLVRMTEGPDKDQDPCLGLADYRLEFDHDGSREPGNRAPTPSEWEATFRLDLPPIKLLQELSLAKIRFQAHGSHRDFPGYYVYHRPSFLFQEIQPSTQAQPAAPSSPAVQKAQTS